MVVAIDGPSGVGKTTTSRSVADALGIPHLDTGAYYRVATLLTLRAGGDPARQVDALDALAGHDVDYRDGRMIVDGDDVTEVLRTDAVTAAVSAVSAHPQVRAALVDLQRAWVAERGGRAVVEGRDIGTVVFPDALVKVFLTADAETRARRRAGDAEASGTEVAAIAEALRARDTADSTRETAPLKAAEGSITIDTSNLSIAEVVGRILDLVGEV